MLLFKNRIGGSSLTMGMFTLLTMSCGGKAPMPRPFDLSEFESKYQTCDRKDSDQPEVSSEMYQSNRVVEDQIASVEREFVDCQKQVISTDRGPERELEKVLLIEPPTSLSEKVQYVSIENFRSCAVNKFDTSDISLPREKILLPDGEILEIPVVMSAADRSGRIALVLTDLSFKLNFYLNVHDGKNVLKIRYFGKCIKQKEAKDMDPHHEADSYVNCALEKQIFSKDLLLIVNVARPEMARKKQIRICRDDFEKK